MKSIARTFCAILILAGALAAHAAPPNYIIVDNQTGSILGSKGRDEKMQIASLTKIATALVVFDWVQVTKADLGAMVEVPPVALTAGGVNPVGLQAGDRISIRDLLYGALIASDNCAALALANHVGSTLPNPNRLEPIGNFVANMNALARQLGMKRTLFLNPHGTDNYEGPLPYSTASDLARLIRYGYSQSDFPFFVSQKNREIHIERAGQSVAIQLQNTNQLLGADGIDGVKTGRTARAGDCIALSADRRPESVRNGNEVTITPRRIIMVLLGSQDRATEGLSLMRQGWTLYDQWAAAGREIRKSQSL